MRKSPHEAAEEYLLGLTKAEREKFLEESFREFFTDFARKSFLVQEIIDEKLEPIVESGKLEQSTSEIHNCIKDFRKRVLEMELAWEEFYKFCAHLEQVKKNLDP